MNNLIKQFTNLLTGTAATNMTVAPAENLDNKTFDIKMHLVNKVLNFNTLAKETSWDTNPEEYDACEYHAAVAYRDLGRELLPSEFTSLRDSWSSYRRSKDSTGLDAACAKIVNRIQAVSLASPSIVQRRNRNR